MGLCRSGRTLDFGDLELPRTNFYTIKNLSVRQKLDASNNPTGVAFHPVLFVSFEVNPLADRRRLVSDTGLGCGKGKLPPRRPRSLQIRYTKVGLRSRGQRGSAILIVLAILFVIMTIILVTSTTQGVSRSVLQQQHEQLQARQAISYQVAKLALGEEAPTRPSWGASDSKTVFDESHFETSSYGANPFDLSQDLNQSRPSKGLSSLQEYPGYRYIGYAKTGSRRRVLALSENSCYAVMSFSSGDGTSVEFDSIKAWQNPGWGSKNPASLYASSPPVVLANGDVDVADFPYGYLYQTNSRAQTKLTSQDQPGAVAFLSDSSFRGISGNNPANYRRDLERDIDGAKDALIRAASAADRSKLFGTQVSRDQTLGMFFSQLAAPELLKERLSLKESQGFWVPTIPAFKMQFEVLYHFIFHVPSSPDGGLDQVSKDARAVLTKFLDAVEVFEKAIEKLEEAKKKLSEAERKVHEVCGCSWKRPWCCIAEGLADAALEAAKLALTAAQLALETAESAIMAIASPITDTLDGILAAEGQVPPPKTRNEEKDFEERTGVELSEEGMEAWAYRGVWNSISSVVQDLISLKFSKIGEDLGDQMTVVFFGQGDKEQGFEFDSAFVSRATWNVPPGKTFYYQGNLEIQGDLWLGRGSTFVVTGNLTLKPGDTPSGGGAAPQGTLHLEEGSSLVVEGAFTAEGESGRGSVLVASPLGSTNSISSAILVNGDVSLPQGVVPGVVLDRLNKVSGGRVTKDSSRVSSELFAPLLSKIAPNLAKVEGPFHSRWPYIAKYATTVEWVGLEEFGVPMIMPEAWGNFHVLVFNGLTYLYAPTLNFEMGENFLTHSDWWGETGEGRPPLLTKPEAFALAQADPDFSLDLDSGDVKNSVQDRSGRIGSEAVDRFANELVIQLSALWAAAIPGEVLPFVSVGEILNKIIKDIGDKYYNLEKRKKALESDVPSGTEELTQTMGDVWRAVSDAQASATNDSNTLAQECSGALVYSGGELNVGGSNSPLSAGLFVAKGDVRLDSDLTVGSAISLGGSVNGKALLFYPPFTHASLYLPQSEDSEWMTRGLATDYGGHMSDSRQKSAKSLPIGPWNPRVVTEVSW